jgi:hypothetical protein
VQITAIRRAAGGVLVRFARRNRTLARLHAELMRDDPR